MTSNSEAYDVLKDNNAFHTVNSSKTVKWFGYVLDKRNIASLNFKWHAYANIQ